MRYVRAGAAGPRQRWTDVSRLGERLRTLAGRVHGHPPSSLPLPAATPFGRTCALRQAGVVACLSAGAGPSELARDDALLWACLRRLAKQPTPANPRFYLPDVGTTTNTSILLPHLSNAKSLAALGAAISRLLPRSMTARVTFWSAVLYIRSVRSRRFRYPGPWSEINCCRSPEHLSLPLYDTRGYCRERFMAMPEAMQAAPRVPGLHCVHLSVRKQRLLSQSSDQHHSVACVRNFSNSRGRNEMCGPIHSMRRTCIHLHNTTVSG